MHTALLNQYQFIVYSREAVFAYLETLRPEDLRQPVPSFNNENIGSLFMHSADTYVAWLVGYARQEQRPMSTKENYKDARALRATFERVNSVVTDFLHHFAGALDRPITLVKREEGMELTTSPLQLFTHVTTHEFHHKGQIINMSRQLGYVPVDTDVIPINNPLATTNPLAAAAAGWPAAVAHRGS